MTANYRYFLVIAEELNISRAARRLFISQQCLSSHLHRLEEEMNSVLFIRKPVPHLTLAGEALVRYLKKMQQLESSLHNELEELNSSKKGVLNIGIHASRARILLPLFMEHYGNRLAKVKINIMDGMTNDFEKKLQNGELDAFIGINPSVRPEFQSHCLMKESVYLVISDSLLRKHFGNRREELIRTAKKGANIEDFQKIPFIINHQHSKLTSSIAGILERQGLDLDIAIHVNGNDMHIELSSMGNGACFAPQMFLPYIEKLNRQLKGTPGELYTFPLNGFKDLNRLCLVHHKDQYMFSALSTFLELTYQLFEDVYGLKPEKE